MPLPPRSLARLAVAALVLAALHLACGVKRFYDGPARPREEIAIVREEPHGQFKVIGIDGQRTRATNEVLPGPHRITLMGSDEDRGDFEDFERCVASIDARAGGEYVVAGRTGIDREPVPGQSGSAGRRSWMGWISDVATGAVVGRCDCYERWNESQCEDGDGRSP